MELQVARQIIDTLAQGIHPVTGQAMPHDSPYNSPPVIRALNAVARALEAPVAPAAATPSAARPTLRVRPEAPANAGKPWTPEDDALLTSSFDECDDLKVLAGKLGRTRFGVEQRLIRLGKIAPPPGGGRFGSSAAAAVPAATEPAAN